MNRLRRRTKNTRKRVRDLRSQWGSPAYRVLFQHLPCVVNLPFVRERCDPSHLKTKGSGGRYYSILPMSRTAHRRWEEHDEMLRLLAEDENWLGWAAWIAEQAEAAGLIADPLPPEGRPPAVEPPRHLRSLVTFWIGHLKALATHPFEYTEEYVAKAPW